MMLARATGVLEKQCPRSLHCPKEQCIGNTAHSHAWLRLVCSIPHPIPYPLSLKWISSKFTLLLKNFNCCMH